MHWAPTSALALALAAAQAAEGMLTALYSRRFKPRRFNELRGAPAVSTVAVTVCARRGRSAARNALSSSAQFHRGAAARPTPAKPPPRPRSSRGWRR